MGWGSFLKATLRLGGSATQATIGSAGKAIIHPATTIRNLGTATKTAVVGGGAAYVGWQKLTTDQSVVGIVSDAVIGEKATEKVITETCLLPFTDMWIMPNGKMGLCCCDNFEVTDFADLTKVPLKEAWSGEAIMEVRRRIAEGRQNYDFCRHCDFIDAGFRMNLVKNILEHGQEAANRVGGNESMEVLHRN